ncbi:GTPase Era [Candidatus Fukatsuia anoeciicola]|uniref:GTPase Era n=1 Tax=Candidatus Fukatsuia anoeciicola TaxID=2994492 RepID=UPI003464BD8C
MSKVLKKHCGFVSIIGRPNVGKSTLLNALLGQKISITSHKPQTTRHCITGIHTEGGYQIIYIDTPGLNIKEKYAINKLMNRAASSTIRDVELVIFVVEGTHWIPNDEMILNKLRHAQCPVLLVINKIDNIIDKLKLLPHIQFISQQMSFLDIIPIAAIKKINLITIANIIRQYIPEAEYCFPENYITDCSQHFLASEIIREKLIRFLGEELPYSITVKIEQFAINIYGHYIIHGLILVERESQKKIVIGNKGAKIKIISVKARQDMEQIFMVKVYLKLWVKIRLKWTDDEYILHNLEYINTYNKQH